MLTYVYSCSSVWQCSLVFTYFTYIYSCLPMFTRNCLPIITHVYSRFPILTCLLVVTYVTICYFCLFTFLPIFTCDCLCLPMSTRVYLSFPQFTRVYICLFVFTYVYSCLPVYSYVTRFWKMGLIAHYAILSYGLPVNTGVLGRNWVFALAWFSKQFPSIWYQNRC